MNNPKKLRRANNNSLYGSERNIPAGEVACRRAATSGNFLFEGETLRARAWSTSVDSTCARLARRTAERV